ncbi:EF-hand domain-containing family member C2-like isoform X2 [Littorina saxatilis]|uniref:EF-hand domain-containing family member C2 n=1 Tax=Littorina saxatilis TaxID=31220 RepID=A0AAN9AN99_9CAEN
MALPFLPGNNFNPSLGKTKHHKSHHFDVCNETSMMVGEAKPGIGGEPLPFQKAKPRTSKFPKGEGSNLPAWVAFDRQVLCFDAFYQEGVVERREEQYRIRKCKIYFYLEDDSIQVIEPRFKNAGVPQGTIIRRHRVPRPPPNDDDFYTVEDFNVGNELNLYSKVFKITGCDDFTHNFLKKLGVRIGQPASAPGDPYMGYRKAMDESMQPLRPYEKYDSLKQFLDHDRHVLRFFCYWDDSENMFGDQRQMVMHYFLADDTIEIREVIPPNAGRDSAPVFVKRGKLPKNIDNLKLPGVVTDRTVLNVFGPMGHGGRYILDSLKTGSICPEFYKDSDLTLGTAINVWGRKFILTDCDEFTREYYRTKFGVNEFTPLIMPGDKGARFNKEFPPYNGFGSEEDSLCSCMSLLPKPPKRDFIKFMERDRRGMDSNVLRFLARMDTEKPIDKDRRFIISYFMSDDTLLVFEPPVRNSGIIGGKFLERGRVKKPNQMPYSIELSEYYTAQDLYVGALVNFNKHKFVLIDADEYAFRYMEQQPQEFPKCNLQMVLEKIRSKLSQNMEDVRSFFTRSDGTGSGVSDYNSFRQLLMQVDGSLTEQEIMCVARHFASGGQQGGMDAQKLVAIAQEQLRKRNYESFNNLLETMQHQDRAKSGFISQEALRTVFLSNHVPLPDDMLRAVLATAPTNENGEVEYGEFLRSINWRDFPVPPMQYQPVHTDEDWKGTVANNEVTSVNYFALLEAIFGKPFNSE